ncbi:protein cordon-bleu-like isoform X1 [Salvelinus namaycush]|uniref:Protein cordon-bleu-like isoform X1 n=1 Tax=Salvelinus namaycush TaxID=8040 RepID=A0A8U0PYJ4_SALNM|nr:protein cordon-bleu-like isoform X1 [Salvelinus namaycush]
MKSRAPPPPPAPEPAPRRIFRNAVPDGGGSAQGSMGSMGMDTKENMMRTSVDLHITLPQGYQTSSTVDGSKALMDLLVDLCSRYHLNPAYHTLELLSSEGLSLAFKPNSLLGSLDVVAISIREKVLQDKVVRKPPPKVPEKTVRLVVNYHRSQKAVVRVSPLAPLESLVPAICEKCEFDPSHVLLLKDNVSNHELELDKCLSELGIRELYVLDQTLEYFCSNTSSVGGAEKKGLLGFLKFNRRKSKTEEQSPTMDMDGLDNNIIQNTEKHYNGLSTVSIMPCVEARPSTLGQSQSVMNISRMSPRIELKKRRAPPAPTPCQGCYTLEAYQVAPDSESTLRKRKAPAPPATSVTPAPSTPAPLTSVQMAPSPSPAPSSPTPSLAAEEDSGSELSNVSVYSSSSSSSGVAAGTSVADTSMADSDSASSRADVSKPGPDSTPSSIAAMADSSRDSSPSKVDTGPRSKTMVNVAPTSKVEKVDSAPSSSTDKVKPTPDSSRSTTPEETRGESALGLKLDEKENNRHSAMGAERPVPLKPLRTPVRELPQLVIPSPPPYTPPPSDPDFPDASPESHREEAPQSWLHSRRLSVAGPQTPDIEVEETLSMGSSGSGSFQDQGYAASEGMAEDSGLVSSPSVSDTTHPTSPDGSLSLGSSGSSHPMIHPLTKDCSSDSDEGCATWGSRHRHSSDISHNDKAGKTNDIYKEDPELTAQLNQTLADLDADLANISHIDAVSVQEHPYVMSTESNDIPVSVVDMEVPVTAIDEVLEDYETPSMTDHQATLMSSSQTTDNKDLNHSHHHSSVGIQNKNNNACMSDGSSKVSSAQPQPAQRLKSPGKKLANGTTGKDRTAVVSKTKVEVQRRESTEGAERKASPVNSSLTVLESHSKSPEEEVPTYRGHTASQSQIKITCSPVSRFGMKTFTIVPPKPLVATQPQKPAEATATLTPGAIRIDDQGNMVKVPIARNKFGGSSESGINKEDSVSPLLGKAKAFWSSTEKQDTSAPSVPTSRGPVPFTKTQSPEPEVPKTTPRVVASDPPAAKATPKACEPVAKMTPKETCKDVVEVTKDVSQEAEGKAPVPVSETPVQQQQPMKLNTGILQDQKRSLSFLKPSRRTSSQYVASAIAKYVVKPTMAKADNIQEVTAELSVPVRKPPGSYGYQKEGRSFHVNPQRSSGTSTNVPVKKESSSGSGSYHASAKCYPDYLSAEKQVVSGESTQGVDRSGYRSSSSLRGGGGSSKSLDSDTVANNTKQHGSNSPSPRQQTPMTPPPPAPQSPTKQVPAVSRPSQGPPPAQSRSETVGPKGHPALAKKPEPPRSAAAAASNNLPEPQQVSLFGPVKKFKPVIMKSVQMDTSLHTTLMSAIQCGDGKERLRKISDSSASSTLKKSFFVEEENERCALLAAIRGQSNSAGLKKTISQAAEELDKFRKTEENRTLCDAFPAMPPPPPFVPPPPPSMLPPPPPPGPPSTQPKPTMMGVPLGAGGNPALARDAMLEAIRSGSAADRLKKVNAPTKTVQVNGRLGTIQAASSLSQEQ